MTQLKTHISAFSGALCDNYDCLEIHQLLLSAVDMHRRDQTCCLHS